MDIEQVIRERHSCRAFLETDVEQAIIEQLLDIARYAPSGANIQPWHIAIVKGKTKQQLTDSLLQARHSGEANPDYQYYPLQWQEPYRNRRITCGKALYTALQIQRDDKQRQQIAWEQNYGFFGAPVALVFYLERSLETGSWLDLGLFMQNIMLSAIGQGLATCPQASIADYPDAVREVLGLSSESLIICGMALGYENKQHPVNQYRTERAEINEFSRWYD